MHRNSVSRSSVSLEGKFRAGSWRALCPTALPASWICSLFTVTDTCPQESDKKKKDPSAAEEWRIKGQDMYEENECKTGAYVLSLSLEMIHDEINDVPKRFWHQDTSAQESRGHSAVYKLRPRYIYLNWTCNHPQVVRLHFMNAIELLHRCAMCTHSA